jgi:peptidyl-prolyl cis-trans isomerase SurA
MKKWIPILLLLLTVAPAGAEMVSKIAAVVNEDIITTHQLDMKLADYFANEAKGKTIPPAQITALREKFLDRLIDETLVLQQIEELGLTVSDAEVDEAIRDVQRKNNLTEEQLTKALESQGMSYEAYKAKLKDQILHFKLIGRQVQSKIDVTDTEIRNYFRAHIDEYREPPYVSLSNLIIRLPQQVDQQEIDEARELAGKTLERLRQGEDFEAVLDELTDAGLAQGGSMGRFKEGEISPGIIEALAGLGPGDYSEPVENLAGFLIFKIDDRTPGRIRQFDQVKVEIKQMLLDEDRDREFKKWSTTLKKKAYIDIRI